MSLSTSTRECTLCISDFTSAVDEKMTDRAPVCVDPDCPDSVCNECSAHEDCCQDCEQEGSVCEDCPADQECCAGCADDCGILDLVNCTGPHCEYHKDYVCDDGSCFELFGDQAAETFGIGESLPQLPLESKLGNTRYQEMVSWEQVPRIGHPGNAASPLHQIPYNAIRHSAGSLMQAAAVSGISEHEVDDRPLPTSQNHGANTAHGHDDCASHKARGKGPQRSVMKPPAHRFVR